MNLVGKIFVVLILVMSILFMAFAISVYHTQRNWKEMAGQLDSKVTQLDGQNRQLLDRIDKTRDQLAHEKAARTKVVRFHAALAAYRRIYRELTDVCVRVYVRTDDPVHGHRRADLDHPALQAQVECSGWSVCNRACRVERDD